MDLFVELNEGDRIGRDAEGSVFIRDGRTGKAYMSKSSGVALNEKIGIYDKPVGRNYIEYIRWVKEVRSEGDGLSLADVRNATFIQ